MSPALIEWFQQEVDNNSESQANSLHRTLQLELGIRRKLEAIHDLRKSNRNTRHLNGIPNKPETDTVP